MLTKALFLTTALLSVYLTSVLLSEYSLVGHLTDVAFAITLSLLCLFLVFKNKKRQPLGIKIMAIVCSSLVFGFICFQLSNIFVLSKFSIRPFYFQKVDNRIFHAYFQPAGAYSGGEGNFWITESPKYFPIIEKEVYYKHAILHNFKDDIFDGQPIDNYEVVKQYIKDEVINKTVQK